MSLVIETYTRKPFEIDAIKVTEANMDLAAEWCNGEILTTEKGKRYIKVDVARPINDKQTKCFAGDWLLRVKTSYKVYTDKAFHNCFDKGTIKSNYVPDNQLPLFEAPKANLPAGYPEPSTR